MAASRRLYVPLAAALKRELAFAKVATGSPDVYPATIAVIEVVAGELQADNPHFNKAKFLTACGVEL